ncbi:MAG TPA: hypothetical protein VMB47_08420, partial [Candidatus Aquilonibacter sp.]|nr:hypothetical protein [Candidatus Aquilonibacter sp.]
MIHWKAGRITLPGLALALVWIGVGNLVDQQKESERLLAYNHHIKTAVQSIDPFALATAFYYRAGCGIRGDCVKCPSAGERILTVDCGDREPYNFSNLLRGGVPEQTQHSNNYFLGLLSIPAAVLFALKSAWAGGWLIFLPGIASVLLAFAIIVRYTELPWIWAFWSVWLTAGLILYLFQVFFLAIGHWIHGLVGVLWFIGFLLGSLELFLKSRHASEFLERR